MRTNHLQYFCSFIVIVTITCKINIPPPDSENIGRQQYDQATRVEVSRIMGVSMPHGLFFPQSFS